MPPFELQSPFEPAGDQPRAIAELLQGLENGQRHQVLLGITGSGKTLTIANVIAKHDKPALVLAHNKTLAAQLYSEFKTAPSMNKSTSCGMQRPDPCWSETT